ncbi:MAG TPA: FecR domain-containing protein [Planctomycetota bacterium]|nr:FecR domain-containing protein [Planctomycetota bacterium]
MDQPLRDELERYLGGGMSDEESRAFLRGIHDNKEAMAYLGQVLTQQAMTFELQRAGLLPSTAGVSAGAEGVTLPLPAGGNGGSRPASSLQKLTWSAGVAAAVLLVATAVMSWPKQPNTSPEIPPVEKVARKPPGLGRIVYVDTTSSEPQAVLVRGGGVDSVETLREGQEVRAGDVIRTQAGRENETRPLAGVQLWNGATMDIAPLSRLALLESERGRNVRLYEGRIYTDVAAGQTSSDGVKIETDFADVELAAGRFDITVDKKSTRLRVESGQGFIFNERGRTIVRRLEESLAQPGVAPNGPLAILATALWRGRFGALSAPKPEMAIDRKVGVVTNIKVLSDKVDDVSSFDAWRAYAVKPEMTDRERATVAFETVVKYHLTDAPPAEYLAWDTSHVMDPIKAMNVYGYGAGPSGIATMLGLARAAGLNARGWAGPNVTEVYWGNRWHVFDPLLIAYFPKADGELASVEELTEEVNAWYAKHPEYRGDDAKLRQFMPQEGWKKGPPTLALCPFLDRNGWNLAATHGWYSFMHMYTGMHPDGNPARPFESGYSSGYQVNIQLREGERLTRNWSHFGMHVGVGWGELSALNPTPANHYTRKFGDVAPARVGNGIHEYNVPLASGAFRLGALASENLASKADDGKTPALHLKDASRPGTYIVRMPSSYVYLDGKLDMTVVVPQGGKVTTSFSDNNGLDWKVIDTATVSERKQIDLKSHVLRRYDYRLKFDIEGEGSGLDVLSLLHTVQHSQRALPILTQGKNTISFSADLAAEGTVTMSGSTNPEHATKQLTVKDFHAVKEGMAENSLNVSGHGRGHVTFPLTTPGDMTRLRIGCFYRARDQRDGWEVSASFDGGKTFKIIDRLWGPTAGHSTALKYTEIPGGSRDVLVRMYGVQKNTTRIFDLRIDADFKEPAGGFRPVKITYNWEENGAPKRHVHVAATPKETYEINCAVTPVMKSIVLELAE